MTENRTELFFLTLKSSVQIFLSFLRMNRDFNKIPPNLQNFKEKIIPLFNELDFRGYFSIIVTVETGKLLNITLLA